MSSLRYSLVPALLFAADAALAAPQWESFELGANRQYMCGCTLDDLAFVVGGSGFSTVSDHVDIYDASTGLLTAAHLPVAKSRAAAAALGRKVYIAGGTLGGPYTDRVDIYDVDTGAWNLETLSLSRGALAAVALGTKVYFAGGFSNLGYTDRIDVFDTAAGTWSTDQLPSPRAYVRAFTIGQRVFFAGGTHFSVLTDEMRVLDTTTSTWSTVTLPAPTASLDVAVVGNRAYLGGGLLTDAIWEYDDLTGTITTIPTPVLGEGRGLARAGDRILLAGGWPVPQVEVGVDRVDVYDLTTGTWQVQRLSLGRARMVALSLGERALFAGGDLPFLSFTPRVDVYTAGPGHAYCSGDGTGQACPCGNGGLEGQGCANSTGASALLTSWGSASAAQAALGFDVAGVPAAQPILLFAGSSAIAGGAGASFGDGLRCAGGTVVRLATRLADAQGATSFPPAQTGSFAAGTQVRYQAWYRDVAGPCGHGFNTSNGVIVDVLP
ncbi:MAG: hypothetical protein H6828_09230 [Planctomycetes bacterium]|nr:hypothetical protein [Planctomycetota bacterium]